MRHKIQVQIVELERSQNSPRIGEKRNLARHQIHWEVMKHGLKTNVTLQQLPTWHNISQRNTTKASINRHNTQTINTQKRKLKCKTKPDQTKQHNGEPQKRWLNQPNFIGVWVSTKRHILKLWPLIPSDSKYTHTSAVLYGFIGKNVYIYKTL